MAIVDQFGNTAIRNTKVIRGSNRYENGLGWQPDLTQDFAKMFSEGDWRSTVTQSRVIISNFPAPRAAAIQKAGYVAGTGWSLEYTGEDTEWGHATADALAKWLDRASIGGVGNFNTAIKSDSLQVDRDGDFFILLLKDKMGAPKYQRIAAHTVGCRDRTYGGDSNDDLKGTEYEGYCIESGVIYDEFHEVVAYQILGEEKENDRIIPSANMIHFADLEWIDQARGIPAVAPVIQELKKAKVSEDFELIAQQIMSTYSMVEYNDKGAADPNDLAGYGANESMDESYQTESLQEGAIKYFKGGSGNKLEVVSSARPSDMWERFQDRMNRGACAAMRWSYELAWRPEGLSAVSVRNAQELCRSTVSQRQMMLMGGYERLIQWGLACLVKDGLIPAPANATDFMGFTFLMPPQMSVDNRHDAKTQLEEWRAGSLNMTQIQRSKGREIKSHYKQRADEIAMREMVRLEAEKKWKVKIDPREMAMLTPNEMAETNESENQQQE